MVDDFDEPVIYRNPGHPPDVVLIDIEKLNINERYQRSIFSKRSKSLIQKIAATFDWCFFQPLSVSDAGGGMYNVLDGQHRLAGARLNGHIRSLPCYLLKLDGVKQEARAFVGLNEQKVTLTPLSSFHGRVVAGDPDALRLKAVLDDCVMVVPKTPRSQSHLKSHEVQAISTLLGLLKKYNDRPIKRALIMLKKVYEGKPGQMRRSIIGALCAIFDAHKDLNEEILEGILLKTTSAELEKEARAYQAVEGGTSHQAVIKALTNRYNKNVPKSSQIQGGIVI